MIARAHVAGEHRRQTRTQQTKRALARRVMYRPRLKPPATQKPQTAWSRRAKWLVRRSMTHSQAAASFSSGAKAKKKVCQSQGRDINPVCQMRRQMSPLGAPNKHPDAPPRASVHLHAAMLSSVWSTQNVLVLFNHGRRLHNESKASWKM
ncbi:hypothetical protein CDD81_3374 [Ophiocordyceps australis]|uniref:Uncharacterized protein n=1 Tax=Ophiocordyceps australis TaxID=1399860 RepID=A0A2C5XX90_9HYPO|nr:hypothetical protein CDD81_3374 [Ophiocordyceps australis]